jgi:hypothetical protein
MRTNSYSASGANGQWCQWSWVARCNSSSDYSPRKSCGVHSLYGKPGDYWRLVGFEVFTAVTTKNAVFWDVAPCRSYEINRRFGGTRARNQREQVAALCCYLLTLVPLSRIFLSWRWRWYVPPKCRFISQDLHDATFQKTAFFYWRLIFEIKSYADMCPVLKLSILDKLGIFTLCDRD